MHMSQNSTRCTLNEDRFLVSEALFNSGWNRVASGVESGADIPSMIHDVIARLPVDLTRSYLQKIYVFGGTTLMPGFGSRIRNELSTRPLASSIALGEKIEIGLNDVKVMAPALRQFSAFKGGSLCAMLWENDSDWLTKKAYNEEGHLHCTSRLHSVSFK
eukprot:GHVO01034282.1.p1 GENE.GHVO01034282.1~~GHVO01034282.1.p1  ORF type:complete len:160 (+),score=28.79 GHVO01034282.1:48-527(+)